MISIPFSGSKRYSYKHVKPIASLGQYDTVYEPFGGSGVLSVNLWNDGIVSKAVVNDYDHFFDDYETFLDLKDLVVRKCYEKGFRRTVTGKGDYEYAINPDGSKEKVKTRLLDKEQRQYLQKVVSENVPVKYWNYFKLGSNFVHGMAGSHRDIKLNDFAYFSKDLSTENQRKYLKIYQQLQIEHLDYRDFLNKFTYDSTSLLLVDPPYIGTSMGQYAGEFETGNTEELIEYLKNTKCDFLFFNQDLEQVRKWLSGFDADYYITGSRNRPDVMAYVKQ